MATCRKWAALSPCGLKVVGVEELEVANGLVGIKCFELPDTYVLPTHWLLYSKGAGGVFTAVSLPRLMPSPLPPKSTRPSFGLRYEIRVSGRPDPHLLWS